jgi:antitoxin (DNA-binding transcriptional repressor) of toxin-antitoxin stability system
METVPISKFRTTCLALLQKVKKSRKPLLITKDGKPVALVSAPPPTIEAKSSFGCMKDAITITGNIVSPLPEKDCEVLKNKNWEFGVKSSNRRLQEI